MTGLIDAVRTPPEIRTHCDIHMYLRHLCNFSIISTFVALLVPLNNESLI